MSQWISPASLMYMCTDIQKYCGAHSWRLDIWFLDHSSLLDTQNRRIILPNTLRPELNGWNFAGCFFKYISLKENFDWGSINNKWALIQVPGISTWSNGLVLNRQKAIMWANHSLVQISCVFVSPSLNELIISHYFYLILYCVASSWHGNIVILSGFICDNINKQNNWWA